MTFEATPRRSSPWGGCRRCRREERGGAMREETETVAEEAAARIEALDHHEDDRLVAAVAAGDKRALGALYDRHARSLLVLGLRILQDRPAAEDVLHDVFIEAWHQAGAFDPARGTVRAWLVMRMRSRVLDRRAQARRRARLADEAGREPGAGGAL